MDEIVINEDVRVEMSDRHRFPVCIVDPMGQRMYLTLQEVAAIAEVVAKYLEALPERPVGDRWVE